MRPARLRQKKGAAPAVVGVRPSGELPIGGVPLLAGLGDCGRGQAVGGKPERPAGGSDRGQRAHYSAATANRNRTRLWRLPIIDRNRRNAPAVYGGGETAKRSQDDQTLIQRRSHSVHRVGGRPRADLPARAAASLSPTVCDGTAEQHDNHGCAERRWGSPRHYDPAWRRYEREPGYSKGHLQRGCCGQLGDPLDNDHGPGERHCYDSLDDHKSAITSPGAAAATGGSSAFTSRERRKPRRSLDGTAGTPLGPRRHCQAAIRAA